MHTIPPHITHVRSHRGEDDYDDEGPSNNNQTHAGTTQLSFQGLLSAGPLAKAHAGPPHGAEPQPQGPSQEDAVQRGAEPVGTSMGERAAQYKKE